MARSKAKQGADFERDVLNKITDEGNSLVWQGMRSAGSHGPADLIVWKEIVIQIDNYPDMPYDQDDLDLYAIQCKHSTSKDICLTTLFKEENVIKLVAMPCKFTKVLCVKQPRSRNIIQLYHDDYSWKLKRIFDI
jgi:hypothetical protein